eukprot:2087272-Pleurochrysis_carterae.AAC.1
MAASQSSAGPKLSASWMQPPQRQLTSNAHQRILAWLALWIALLSFFAAIRAWRLDNLTETIRSHAVKCVVWPYNSSRRFVSFEVLRVAPTDASRCSLLLLPPPSLLFYTSHL